MAATPHRSRRRLGGLLRSRWWRLPGLLGALVLALPATATVLSVAADGSAQYHNVQAAVDAAVARALPATIVIAPGTYREVVDIPVGAPPIALRGRDAATTTIVFDNHAARISPASGQPFGTSGSATLFVRSNDFSARHLTFANDAGPVGQAVAVRISGTRAAFEDVRFLGHQDTLYLQGQDTVAWFGDCHIEGTVDFIFGAGTALFENCRIHSLADGYVTAAATPQGRRFGYVFRDCTLTAAAGVEQVYLGRPWRDHAKVAVIDSTLGAHIVAAGWHDWDQPHRQTTTDYAEYRNQGAGAGRDGRVGWSRTLTAEEAAGYTPEQILGDWRAYR